MAYFTSFFCKDVTLIWWNDEPLWTVIKSELIPSVEKWFTRVVDYEGTQSFILQMP